MIFIAIYRQTFVQVVELNSAFEYWTIFPDHRNFEMRKLATEFDFVCILVILVTELKKLPNHYSRSVSNFPDELIIMIVRIGDMRNLKRILLICQLAR